MTPDRVVLLNRWFAPETFGGTETSVYDLARTLQGIGVDVTVVCETRSLSTGWSTVDGLRVFRHQGSSVPGFAWSLRPAAAFVNVVRRLKELRPEIGGQPIIARMPAYAAAARVAFPDARITYWAPGSRPWFGLFQGRRDLDRRERFWEWVDEAQNAFVRRRALQRSNLVVAESRHVQRDLIARLHVDPAKLRLRPIGVDLSRFRPRAHDAQLAAELAIPAEAPVVVSAARFEPMKNIDLLIRAFARLENREAVLVLVGDGTEAPKLRRLAAELNISGRVRFAGWRADVERFYSIATAFVLPSVYEPYGLAYGEALASGVPTIGVRPSEDIFVASDEHIVEGSNGFLVDAEDASELAGALDRLLSDATLRGRLSQNARKVALQRYDWRATAMQFLGDFPVN